MHGLSALQRSEHLHGFLFPYCVIELKGSPTGVSYCFEILGLYFYLIEIFQMQNPCFQNIKYCFMMLFFQLLVIKAYLWT